MNFKEEFLKLTKFTTPFKFESELEPFLLSHVPDLLKDSIGNYHKIIGESETLFTCHLDNFCKTKQEVNHIVDDDIVMSDGSTILGADNKAGVLVLLYLISNNVQGHYCFFIGEEPILSGGLYGSSLFATSYKNIRKFKRAIAFDRKGEASIITRQMAQNCCSSEFSAELCNLFIQQDIWMEPDNTGYYTDTASFLEFIPECTNISVGVYDEHTKQEYVDLRYLEKIAKAAAKINWEELPCIREAKPFLIENDEDVVTSGVEMRLFKLIKNKLSNFNFLCMNKNKFQSEKTMIFSHWFEDLILNVKIIDNEILINDIRIPHYDTEEPIIESELQSILSTIFNQNETV